MTYVNNLPFANVVGTGVGLGVVGHAPTLQGWLSEALPIHCFPPLAGRGLVQVLVLE